MRCKRIFKFSERNFYNSGTVCMASGHEMEFIQAEKDECRMNAQFR